MRNTSFLPAALLALSLATIAAPAEAAPGNVGALNGVWEVQGTPDANNCNAVPFTNLVAITRDGTITNVDPDVGTGVGEAYRSGRRTFTVGFFGFINSSVIRYEIQATAKLINYGELRGRFRTTLSDTGTPFCTFEGTIRATRLIAMPY